MKTSEIWLTGKEMNTAFFFAVFSLMLNQFVRRVQNTTEIA